MDESVDYQPGTHRDHEARRQRVDRDRPGLNRVNDQIVKRLSDVLTDLQTAGKVARSSQISGQPRSGRVGSEADEGSPTRWARNMERRIQKRLVELLNEYDARVEGTYQPPEKPDRVRCVWTRCQAYGKRIPRYVGPANQIELSRCPMCDKKLTAA